MYRVGRTVSSPDGTIDSRSIASMRTPYAKDITGFAAPSIVHLGVHLSTGLSLCISIVGHEAWDEFARK